MKKQITAIILAICAFTSLLNVTGPTAETAAPFTVNIFADVEKAERVTVLQNEKKELTAVCSPGNEESSFQWQICVDIKAELWVDIYGATGKTIQLSYPMMKSLLDNSGSAYVRCRFQTDSVSYYSEPVCATVSFEAHIPDENQYLANPGADNEEQTPASLASNPSRAYRAPAAATAGDAESSYITVTVKYLDYEAYKTGQEQELYSPYTARLLKGSAFTQNVISPTFLGYAPYLADPDNLDNLSDATVLNLNYKEGELIADTEIKVLYKAIEVPYAVRYFYQNVGNDLYTERSDLYYSGKAITGTIIENQVLEDHAGDTTGFAKLYHYPESVAADGSTVFECYYDRIYYFLRFDLNGGYGVDPIYARYGTPFAVNNPTRHGYIFAGWDLLNEEGIGDGYPDPLPSFVGSSNQNYRAIWKKDMTSFKVVYWLENANDENGQADGNGYSYWGSVTIPAVSSQVITCAEYTDYTKYSNVFGNPEPADNLYLKRYSEFHHADEGTKIVEGDGSTVVNVYYNRKEYNLRFYYSMEDTTKKTHYVVGGTTHYFGSAAAGNYNESNQESAITGFLNSYMTGYRVETDSEGNKYETGQIGQITKKPELNENGKKKVTDKLWTLASTTSGNYEYHYLEFSAKYGEDISAKWPIAVFGPSTRSIANNHGNWSSLTTFRSAWNGEHHVYYTQAHKNDNQTIKGKYSQLDYQLLWNPTYGDSSTVSYLCFWENGANVGWSIPKLFNYNIFLEALDGSGYVLEDSYTTVDNSTPGEQTIPALTGYKLNSSTSEKIAAPEGYQEAYNMNYKYDRNQYTLSFYNRNGVLIRSDTVKYGADISKTGTPPTYPDTFEPNAYHFDGWYTTSECIAGTEFDFEGATMPAKNLALKAKWAPNEHTVRFFKTRDDMLEYEKTGNPSLIYETITLPHGNVVGEVPKPTDPSGNNYSFGGWFYENADGSRQAYAEYDTPINRDMNIYADWGSKKAQPYVIHYALESFESKDSSWFEALAKAAGEDPQINQCYTVTLTNETGSTETRTYIYYSDKEYHQLIGDDTTGYAYEGSTRTFNAKVGDPYYQLFDGYNKLYFPTLASHSITIAAEMEGTLHPENNVFTFFYVAPKLPIYYIVRYIDKESGLALAKEVLKPTNNSLVTERFLPVADYIPDAFYKRLTISVKKNAEGEWVGSDEDNVITFYYTKNDTTAYYAVHHMLQKLGSDGSNMQIDGTGDYAEDNTIIEGIADVGKEFAITPQTFDGFEMCTPSIQVINGKDETKVSLNRDNTFTIKIDTNGTELYIFYQRKTFDVKVQYLIYNTEKPVPGVENPVFSQSKQFGSVVSHTAPQIAGGYVLVDPNSITKSIVVRSNEKNPNINVITFYYTEEQYIAEYKIIGDIGGHLSSTIEVQNTSSSFDGSTATAAPGYTFVGWYLDEAATQPVGEKAIISGENGEKLTPQAAQLAPTPTTNIFYAKFELQTADLTITRENANDEGNGAQVFVYKITDQTDPDKVYYVTITGNGSATIKDLPCVSYKIQQMNDWSWRYDDSEQTIALTENEPHTVTFNDRAIHEKWLNGNSNVVKNIRN